MSIFYPFGEDNEAKTLPQGKSLQDELAYWKNVAMQESDKAGVASRRATRSATCLEKLVEAIGDMQLCLIPRSVLDAYVEARGWLDVGCNTDGNGCVQEVPF